MPGLSDALVREEPAAGRRRRDAAPGCTVAGEMPPVDVRRVADGPGASISVLKFGSSVLACPRDYLRVADALAVRVAMGSRIVAVVSAMEGQTDALLSAARSVSPRLPGPLIGALLATGEEASVALLVLALAGRGVRAEGFIASRLPILTRGALDDAEPIGVDAARLRTALQRSDVVVFPGFVGVDVTGVPSLLGRGGSDLTALFLGHALGDAEVCLVKDVDGVYPADPRTNPEIAAYEEMDWSEAIRVGGEIVQGKAVEFAQRHRMRFRVAGMGGRGTWVGRVGGGAG